MSEQRQARCVDRVAPHWKSRKEDLDRLWAACTQETEPDDETTDESIYEYGLSFDYVAPESFTDQLEGYWRYQLSWGGPSDEIRFCASGPDQPCYRIEYWFDGAHIDITSDETANTYWGWFQDVGSTQVEFDKET